MDDIVLKALWEALDNVERQLQDGIYHVTYLSNNNYRITFSSGKQIAFDRHGQAEDYT